MNTCKGCGSPMFGGACMKCSGEKKKSKGMSMKPQAQAKGKNANMMMNSKRGK